MKCLKEKCIHHDVCALYTFSGYASDECGFYETRQHSEWIPCSERLPEEGVYHLGWIERDIWVDGDDYPTRKQEFAIGWHIEGRWHFDGYSSTTKCIAWMPLPESYKEEGDSDA